MTLHKRIQLYTDATVEYFVYFDLQLRFLALSRSHSHCVYLLIKINVTQQNTWWKSLESKTKGFNKVNESIFKSLCAQLNQSNVFTIIVSKYMKLMRILISTHSHTPNHTQSNHLVGVSECLFAYLQMRNH